MSLKKWSEGPDYNELGFILHGGKARKNLRSSQICRNFRSSVMAMIVEGLPIEYISTLFSVMERNVRSQIKYFTIEV